jgi:hypothetical protein
MLLAGSTASSCDDYHAVAARMLLQGASTSSAGGFPNSFSFATPGAAGLVQQAGGSCPTAPISGSIVASTSFPTIMLDLTKEPTTQLSLQFGSGSGPPAATKAQSYVAHPFEAAAAASTTLAQYSARINAPVQTFPRASSTQLAPLFLSNGNPNYRPTGMMQTATTTTSTPDRQLEPGSTASCSSFQEHSYNTVVTRHEQPHAASAVLHQETVTALRTSSLAAASYNPSGSSQQLVAAGGAIDLTAPTTDQAAAAAAASKSIADSISAITANPNFTAALASAITSLLQSSTNNLTFQTHHHQQRQQQQQQQQQQRASNQTAAHDGSGAAPIQPQLVPYPGELLALAPAAMQLRSTGTPPVMEFCDHSKDLYNSASSIEEEEAASMLLLQQQVAMLQQQQEHQESPAFTISRLLSSALQFSMSTQEQGPQTTQLNSAATMDHHPWTQN